MGFRVSGFSDGFGGKSVRGLRYSDLRSWGSGGESLVVATMNTEGLPKETWQLPPIPQHDTGFDVYAFGSWNLTLSPTHYTHAKGLKGARIPKAHYPLIKNIP